MFRHEGVSCDVCRASNFRGKRFKCLRCKDYDLCVSCFDLGPLFTRHPKNHPYQCVLTQSDYDLFYGGELSPRQRSYTCPICGKMGFTQNRLVKHGVECHEDASTPVVCPICVVTPQHSTNTLHDEFSKHLAEKHGETASLNEFHFSATPTERRSSSSPNNIDTLSEIFSQIVLSKKKPEPQPVHGQNACEPGVPNGQCPVSSSSVGSSTQNELPTTTNVLLGRIETENQTEQENENRDESLAVKNLFAQRVVLASSLTEPAGGSPLSGGLASYIRERSTMEFEDVFTNVNSK